MANSIDPLRQGDQPDREKSLWRMIGPRDHGRHSGGIGRTRTLALGHRKVWRRNGVGTHDRRLSPSVA